MAECLAPWSGNGDPAVDPKPIDQAALARLSQFGGPPEALAFERAKIDFEAHRFPEAAKGFHALAVAFPDSDVGGYGAELFLECLNVLGMHANRPACNTAITTAFPELFDLYCSARRGQNVDTCKLFDRIGDDLKRLEKQRSLDR